MQLTNANLRQFVAITPSKLSFKPNVNYQYFTITVNNEYDLTTNPNNLQISFTKDGIDAEAFADIGELSFSILDNTSIE